MKLDLNKNQFFKNVLFAFIAFAIYKLIGKFAISRIENGVINAFVTELTLFICAICCALATKKMNTLKWQKRGFGTGIIVGLFILCIQMLNLFSWIHQYIMGVQTVTISCGEIILFFLAMVMVGVSEELLFRGVLLNSCLEYFGESSISSLKRAIIISGSIFGLFHIFNVLIGASLFGSIIQAINAVALGIVFGVIYVRSDKNIWPCIFLHSIQDTAAFLQSGMMNGGGVKDTISSYSANMIPTIVVLFLVGLFLMRKKKMVLCVKQN
ncbi:MAG: CPBP family intramembrane metalloprotease [Lachnospiraceae bacterium]|nr:CPBP family intramembrane metalloprotease [Lachnospiraceae bacterium]